MPAPLRRAGLFQAFVKGKDNGATYLVTFPAPQIADEWYRNIMDSVPNNSEPIKRISPQYYIYDAAAMPDGQGIYQSTKEFVVTGPLRLDQATIYPALRYTNHVSGNWFAIRSLEDPGLYWTHEPSDGSVVVSRTKRTYFHIWIVEPAKPPGTIMIGTDKVRMSIHNDSVGNPLYREDGGLRFLQSNAGNNRQVLQFNFSEFRSGFGAYQGNQVFYAPGPSEEWELV